ncbi:MAG: hypothetical protein DRP01_09045 [Archaeoglobales archaeon]|nr:MAG: hypothetical protein DRP01_09045 [Archaeoglobales archaeon]
MITPDELEKRELEVRRQILRDIFAITRKVLGGSICMLYEYDGPDMYVAIFMCGEWYCEIRFWVELNYFVYYPGFRYIYIDTFKLRAALINIARERIYGPWTEPPEMGGYLWEGYGNYGDISYGIATGDGYEFLDHEGRLISGTLRRRDVKEALKVFEWFLQETVKGAHGEQVFIYDPMEHLFRPNLFRCVYYYDDIAKAILQYLINTPER